MLELWHGTRGGSKSRQAAAISNCTTTGRSGRADESRARASRAALDKSASDPRKARRSENQRFRLCRPTAWRSAFGHGDGNGSPSDEGGGRDRSRLPFKFQRLVRRSNVFPARDCGSGVGPYRWRCDGEGLPARRRAGKASGSHGGVGDPLRVKAMLKRGSTIEAGRITGRTRARPASRKRIAPSLARVSTGATRGARDE